MEKPEPVKTAEALRELAEEVAKLMRALSNLARETSELLRRKRGAS